MAGLGAPGSLGSFSLLLQPHLVPAVSKDLQQFRHPLPTAPELLTLASLHLLPSA